MNEKTIITFGKYKNQTIAEVIKTDISYLQWMVDNIENKIDLINEIKAQIENSKKIEYTLDDFELPDLSVRIRGGGNFHDGTHIESVNESLFSNAVKIESDNRSKSNASGSYTYCTPEADGVYLLTEDSGSINNHSSSSKYIVLKNKNWFSIRENNKNSVKQYMVEN